MATNALPLRGPRSCSAARRDFLAGSALARDEHRRRRVGDPREQIVHTLHRGAAADQLAEVARILERAPERRHLGAQPSMLDRAVERDHQDVGLDRLRDEIVRTGANRADGMLDGPECRDDDDGNLGTALDDALAQLEPIHALHAQVRHDDVHVVVAQGVEGVLPPRAPDHLEAAFSESVLQRLAQAALVIDEQDAARHDASLWTVDSSRAGVRKTSKRAP